MRKNEIIIRTLKALIKMCNEHNWKWDVKPYGKDRVLVIIDVPNASVIAHVNITNAEQALQELVKAYVMCLGVTA